MADETDDGGLLPDRPAPDKLARAVSRSRVAEKLFATAEPVKVGRYQLLEMVGTGGMGVVWGAWDPELGRRVAIKLLSTTHAKARDRTLAEGQALAKLSHPNVVPIYDVGVFDEQVYLVMEWVRGKTLRAWCSTERDVRAIVAVYREAGAGLEAAHEAGLVHRDFKPDNAIVGDDGRVRVLDFGLARDATTDAPLGVAGTPRYMAPEQTEGLEPTPAVDQFAFGISLREALVGRSANGRDAEVPNWLTTITARATAPAPTDRFGSMTALLAELARDPRTVWGRRIALAAALGLAGGAFAAGTMRGESVERCGGGGAEIATAWALTDHDALATHLRTLGPYGTSVAALAGTELDTYATRWAGAHAASCRAHEAGELPRARYEETLGCLARSRASLRAAHDVLVRSDIDRLPDALVAARSLPDPAQCRTEAETSTIAPPSMMVASRVAELGNDIARARVLALALDPQAVAVAATASKAADALGYAPLAGRAALAHGVALLQKNERRPAIEVLERAHGIAFAAGDHATGVEAFARELYAIATTSRDLPAFAEATTSSSKLAESIARGLGPTGAFARALLLNNLGILRQSRRDPEGARAYFEAALLERPPVTASTYELASILGNLGLGEKDPDRRTALFAQEHVELAAAVGEDHPLTLDARAKGAAFDPSPAHARVELRDTCLRAHTLHPHLADQFSLFAYDLVWLAFDDNDLAAAREALAWVTLDDRLARSLILSLEGKHEEAAALARAKAEELLAREQFWGRWRAVDALLVVALAERSRGDLAAARTYVDRAIATAKLVDSLSNTMLYQRRIARLEALRRALAT